MKIYVLATSLALLAGTAAGYVGGKSSAEAAFASDCTDSSFALVYDYSSDKHRHFHCFELDATGAAEPASDTTPKRVFVL
jgi:hypothetical protein